MNNRDDDEKDSSSLNFSQYIPNWRNDDDDGEEYFYEEIAISSLDQEEIMFQNEDCTIKVKHFKEALSSLAREKGTNGPFTLDEVTLKIQDILAKERLQDLINKGLIGFVNGKIRVTEKGMKLIEQQLRRPRN